MIRALFVGRVDFRDDDDFSIRSREWRRQRKLGRAILRESQRLLVEIERLERRRKSDRGVRGFEDFAEKARRVLAKDFQLQTLGRALDDVREFFAVFAE